MSTTPTFARLHSEAEDASADVGQAGQVVEIDDIRILVRAAQEATADLAAVSDQLKRILERYQENSQLLDPYLPEIVPVLAASLRSSAGLDRTREAPAALSDANWSNVGLLARMLWTVVSVRGHKSTVNFFPHSATDLEPVLALLLQVDTRADCPPVGRWEAQCILLLWLSQLVLLPFNLCILDSELAEKSSLEDRQSPPLVRQLVEACKGHLASPASSRGMAALLLGRLLTRPDTASAQHEFLVWSAAALGTSGHESTFLVPGVAHALAAIMKSGQQNVLAQGLPLIWGNVTSLYDSRPASRSPFTRKLAVKLVHRVGLVLLRRPTPAASPPSGQAGEEVPERLEEILGVLLQALQDSDTIVRWSAAKGIARIVGLLQQEHVEEIVDQVVEIFKEKHNDTAWHGALLSLAGLAKSRLLQPGRLHAIAAVVSAALQLDVRRGAHSVGAHVRDAAAYVCWAFARAYSAEVMAPIVLTLAPALITVACYDREVNCRRAAAAAFQENVGRQGSFPHGIEILAAADYFSIGARSQAFLVVAPFVATFGEYRPALRDHLLDVKLRHWEPGLRELASQALAALLPAEPEYFQSAVLLRLLPLCTDVVVEVRHGALLGIAEVLQAIQRQDLGISVEHAQAISSLPECVASKGLLRGKGGELTRIAVCRLIESIAEAKLTLDEHTVSSCRVLLDENLRHANVHIQAQASAAFAVFSRGYFARCSETIAEAYLDGLDDPSASVRRGCAAAVGVLPHWILEPVGQRALTSLARLTKVEEQVELRDVDCRVIAVKALASAATELLCRGSEGGAGVQAESFAQRAYRLPQSERSHWEAPSPQVATGLSELICNTAVAALLAAMQDYSIDNRGDVGSWVREASMEALPSVLSALMRQGFAASCLAQCAAKTVEAMLQQSVERIAKIRQAALSQLGLVLSLAPDEAQIPARDRLKQICNESTQTSVSSLEVVERVAELLDVLTYREAILLGLVFSMGGIDGALTQVVRGALQSQLKKGRLPDDLCESFIVVWQRNLRVSRLATGFMRAAAALLAVQNKGTASALSTGLSGKVLDAVASEIKGCRDVARLCAAADVLASLAQAGRESGRRAALSSLSGLLASRLPKVRKYAAEQLYLQLLSEDEEAATDVLLQTCWDSNLDQTVAAQRELRQLLQLQ